MLGIYENIFRHFSKFVDKFFLISVNYRSVFKPNTKTELKMVYLTYKKKNLTVYKSKFGPPIGV